MGLKQEEFDDWVEEGKKKKYKYLIVVVDTFDYECYPVYVKQDEDLDDIKKEYNFVDMQRIKEVVELNM